MMGTLLMPVDSLKSITLQRKIDQDKYYIILNIHKSYPGHWLALMCYLKSRKCVIYDAANEFKDWPEVVHLIRQFCQKNQLKPINFAVQCQRKNSYICGQLCLTMCAKMHNCNLREIFDLRTLLQKHSIPSVEKKMLAYATDHFSK